MQMYDVIIFLNGFLEQIRELKKFNIQCFILAPHFECNFQITWQKLTGIIEGEIPSTPIHSAPARERQRMDRDASPQPVQKPEVTRECQFSSY